MGRIILVLYLVLLLADEAETSVADCIPRKTVKYHAGQITAFMKEGLANISTLLVNEETDTLFVGGRDAVFALDLNNISREIAKESWFATKERQQECIRRGKDKLRCQNYILSLHKINDSYLYVCGTNAYHPTCDHMVIHGRNMNLQGRAEESRGQCPFEPTLNYASIFVDGEFYSATSNNFLGTEPIILRNMKNPVRTEFKTSWLNEPSFVAMELVRASDSNPNGDDDKIYAFFTETAVEFEFYDKLLVSRIARVCRGDLGGKRILQKRWTSFLKSRLACSVPELNFHFNIVQDIFFLRRREWQESIFYGIFYQQWGRLDISAVCAYSMKNIEEVFSKGNYKEAVAVEHSPVKWMLYRGDVPVPRPGACIDNFARGLGYNTSSDLPDKVLQFVRDHPLMHNSVNPIGDRAVLLKRGSTYTRIVIERVTGLDKHTYDVMFLGTDDGYLHKALSCDGEMFIVEELQLFPSPEPVRALRLSAEKGMLYAGSQSQVVQLPVSECGRYKHCVDCVLARDPYCAWSQAANECVLLAQQAGPTPLNLIQSVKYGDASSCLSVENSVRKCVFTLGNSVYLSCVPLSNLASVVWKFNGSKLQAGDPNYLLYPGGIAILNVTLDAAGFYDCLSVEKSRGKEFHLPVARYALYAQEKTAEANNIATAKDCKKGTEEFLSLAPPLLPNEIMTRESVASQAEKMGLRVLVVGLGLLFLFLLIWNFRKGHLPLPRKSRVASSKPTDAAGPESAAPAAEGLSDEKKDSVTEMSVSSANECE